MVHVYILLTVVLYAQICSGLICYTCENLSSSVIGITGNANANCAKPNRWDTPTEECPTDDGQHYRCGYLEAGAKFAGLISGKVQVRTCVPVENTESDISPIGKCGHPSKKQLMVINKLLALTTKFESLEVDAKMCICGTDYCDNSRCNGWSLGDICIPAWSLYTVGAVAALLVFSCCLCCYCCCCRRRQPGTVMAVVPAFNVTTPVPYARIDNVQNPQV